MTRGAVMTNIKQKLVRLFRNNRIMNIQTMQEQLPNKSQRSIFRYLTAEGYYSSYTHAGKYYTLKSNPNFNSEGLWFYNEIGFSKQGTLKSTVIFLINNAKTGRTHAELKKILRIRVHNVLLELTKLGKLFRIKFTNKYVYVSSELKLKKRQVKERQLLIANEIKSKARIPSELVQIKILVEIIRSDTKKIEPVTIMKRLKKCGIKLSLQEIKDVIHFYGLKKN